MKKVLWLNGPNINMTGVRQPELYGSVTYEAIKNAVVAKGAKESIDIDFRQSNYEGELVTWIQQAYGVADGLVINPGAYTHTSVAIQDALRILNCPILELHFNNSAKTPGREFRLHSFVRPVASGLILGFGPSGYLLAVEGIRNLIVPPTFE